VGRRERGGAAGLRLRAGVAEDGAGLAAAGLPRGSLGVEVPPMPTCHGSWRGMISCGGDGRVTRVEVVVVTLLWWCDRVQVVV